MIEEEIYLNQVIADQIHQAFLVDLVFWGGVVLIVGLQIWARFYFGLWKRD
jgi:hypothetical protein|tara:strand:+ start:151 stop:303 length:153 start_codon:yes stop_codon:yes gene_type:complete